MSKQKLYFKDSDEIICTSIQSILEDAKEQNLTSITVFEAIPDNETKDFVWCTHYFQITEKSICKKSECSMYSSKSGRGVCKHRGKLYLHGKQVTFDVPADVL